MNNLQPVQFIKTFTVNVLLMGVVLYLITIVANLWLNSYTRHGEALSLPNLKGLNIEDAIKLLEQKKLRYLITDTVFVDNMPKLAVVEQNPSPNSNVKEGRIIYLSVNSNTGVWINMPNLINSSLRFAETVLAGQGLVKGNIIYKPDIAQNAVLDQLYKGQSIQPGTKVPKGATIDLVVGDGSGGTPITMPDLRGLTYQDAINVLKQTLLVPGVVVFEDGVTDTARAVVKRQNPPFTEGATINTGSQVDLYLTK
jgi:hypothetical protein